MDTEDLEIPGVRLITPKRHGDARGFFSETFSVDAYFEAIGVGAFVQDNHSYSRRAGTVRGLHFQSPPHAQGKLVRCVRGRILDVVVDARRGSPHYGQHAKAELSAENWRQMWAPPGFLHGFLTLEDDTEVLYKVTAAYAPEADGAVYWADPDLAVDWGLSEADAVVSDKDRNAVRFADFDTPFAYDDEATRP
ncbi:MAG: dTDP-4-dehydrorhamnose 3,5-epimerase [Pseudomonadota bacterium]